MKSIAFLPTIFAASVLALTTTTAAHAYDPVTDFSITNNQNVAGVWSYGQTATRGGTFSVLTNPVASSPFAPNSNVESWQGNVPGFQAGYPNIGHNKTSTTQTYSTVIHPADELILHPGPGGQYAVLRFTVPTTGAYRFQGTFTGRDVNTTTTDVAILLNSNTTLFTGGINIGGSGNVATFDVARTFAAGDNVDFSVGYGNNFYGNDSTGLKLGATNAAVAAPEPSALAFLALPALGFISVRRKRQVRR